MNILTDKLPCELIICEKTCPINTDFRIWIQVSKIIYNKQLSIENMLNMLKMVFFSLPPNLYEALRAIADFLNPKEEEISKPYGRGQEKVRQEVFDYDFDAEYIYAAFMQQYKLDLCTANLHWWQFKALFNGLSEDTQFSKIVGYRAVDLKDIKDKEMKKQYKKCKELYKLPDNRTQEQKEADFNENLSALF